MRNLYWFFPIGFLVVLSFQNCGGSFEARHLGSAAPASIQGPLSCEDELFLYFEQSFYQKFKEVGCDSCHNQSTLLNFSDQDIDVAFEAFNQRTPEHFASKIDNENHQQGLLGYDKSSLVSSLYDYAEEFKKTDELCTPVTDLSHTTETRLASFFDEPQIAEGQTKDNRCGFNDPILLETTESPFSEDKPKTDVLEWDLGAEDPRLEGVIARLEVAPESPQGFPLSNPEYVCPNQDGYQVGALRLISTINKIRLKNVSVVLNGDDQGNRHYFGVELDVGPGEEEVYMLGESGGFTIYTMVGHPVLRSDSWQLQFEEIEVEE